MLTGFAADVARLARSAPPIGLVQVARYANPQNSGAAVLLALLLDDQDRPTKRSRVLGSVPASDPLVGQARDIQVRILNDQKNFNQAYAVAQGAALRSDADIGDFSRLGDVYAGDEAPRPGRRRLWEGAIALATAQGLKSELWPLLLLRANALEQAKRWPEAKQALEQALVIAPDQPLLLNFLGYAKLERGEDLDSSEAMIRKASALSPDDASITDSLGWAQFKRGKVADAIATLQRAAEKDPRPGRNPGASRRRLVHLGPPVRGALRVERGAGHRRGRGRGAAPRQACFGAHLRQRSTLIPPRETAPAKLNLALHVRGELPDGRHAIETIFAFCTDGDRLSAEPADEISLAVSGQFAADLPAAEDNLVIVRPRRCAQAAGVNAGAAI